MASNLMIDDRLHIDRFNPTTWTGDFGINKDGFRKDLFIDGSYTTAIDEKPVDYSDDLDSGLKPRDLSGNVHLKTIDPNYAPHGAFPTRKFEYSDGTVTWYRPELPWSWMGSRTAEGPGGNLMKIIKKNPLIVLIVLVIVFYILSRIKK
jgi:hypothetical protein